MPGLVSYRFMIIYNNIHKVLSSIYSELGLFLFLHCFRHCTCRIVATWLPYSRYVLWQNILNHEIITDFSMNHENPLYTSLLSEFLSLSMSVEVGTE